MSLSEQQQTASWLCLEHSRHTVPSSFVWTSFSPSLNLNDFSSSQPILPLKLGSVYEAHSRRRPCVLFSPRTVDLRWPSMTMHGDLWEFHCFYVVFMRIRCIWPCPGISDPDRCSRSPSSVWTSVVTHKYSNITCTDIKPLLDVSLSCIKWFDN